MVLETLKKSFWILFGSVLSLVPMTVSATTMSGGTVGDLSKAAGWIGRVEIEEIQTVSSSSEFPFTKVKGRVLEIFKGAGETGESVSFQIPGGQRGKRTFAVVGIPSFKIGGEYVLFLDSAPRASSSALSLSVVQVGLVGWTAFRVVQTDRQVNARAVVRAGEPSLLQHTVNGYELTHDRAIKNYDDFVAEIYRSLD